MEESKDKISTANKWAERLRGRGRMAVAAIGGMFMAGFFGVSQPLSARIDTANERLAKANARAQLAGEVSELRHQAALYEKKLSRGVDPNDWTNYLLEGIRSQNVKLIRMDPKDTASMGPCKVLSWQIDIEGDLESLGRVVAFLENGSRLMRIDRVVLQSAKEGSLGMALLVKGLALDIPLEKVKEEKLKAEKRAAAAARNAEKSAGADEDIPQAMKDAMPKMPEAVKIPGLGDFKLPKAPPDSIKKAAEEAK
jgi:type II secretory pathway component PulM